jgi:trk system potassium uptake protein TrkH
VLAVPRLARHAVGRRRGRRPPVTAQVKLVLAATAVLLAIPFLFLLVVEWHNTLDPFSFWDRVHNAWFQAVTPRTAGFNSLEIAELRPASRTLLMFLMFVGGSPGGTAGGIKTTTATVLLLAVAAAIRGRQSVTSFGRRIRHATIYKAASIATAGVASLCVALVSLQLTQALDPEVALFESVSALGTVGLTIGGTQALDGVGRLLVMVCMFSGRVGPLTLFMFLNERVERAYWQYPEEEIEVG